MDKAIIQEQIVPMLEKLSEHMDLILEEVPVDNGIDYMREVLVSLQVIHNVSGNLRNMLLSEIRTYTDTIAGEDDDKESV